MAPLLPLRYPCRRGRDQLPFSFKVFNCYGLSAVGNFSSWILPVNVGTGYLQYTDKKTLYSICLENSAWRQATENEGFEIASLEELP